MICFFKAMGSNTGDVDVMSSLSEYQANEYINPSVPLYYYNDYIISAKQFAYNEPFRGVFDFYSYGLILLSLLMAAASLSITMKLGMPEMLFLIWKLLLKQSFVSPFHQRSIIGHGQLAMFAISFALIGSMYSSIVISFLSVKKTVHQIDTLETLFR